jgi:hypothetical protein
MGNRGTSDQPFTAGPVRRRVKWTWGQDRGWIEVTPDHIAFLTSPSKAWMIALWTLFPFAVIFLFEAVGRSDHWELSFVLGAIAVWAGIALYRSSRFTKEIPPVVVTELRFERSHVQTVTLQLPRRETFRGTTRPLEIWASGECHRFDLLMDASDIRALGDHLAAWYPTDVAIMPPLSGKGMA